MSQIYVQSSSHGLNLHADSYVNNHFLYSTTLMPLYETEKNLTGGRFTYFKDQDFEHAISYELHNIDGLELKHRFEEYIDTIANLIEQFKEEGIWSDDFWSVYVTLHSVGNITLTFKFTNLEFAIFCRMTLRN